MSETERSLASASHQIEKVNLLLSGELPSRSLLEQYQPKPEWFLRKQAINSIHGIGHETRVMVWQEILSRLLAIAGAKLDQEALRWAAATHDTQRLDDDYDWSHGERSAVWVTGNLDLEPATLERVVYLNRWHVPPDHSAPQMTAELSVFKDADGLDRARLGDLNPRYLRHVQSRNLLIEPAEALYSLSSELQWRKSLAPFESVIAAAIKLGIIIDN